MSFLDRERLEKEAKRCAPRSFLRSNHHPEFRYHFWYASLHNLHEIIEQLQQIGLLDAPVAANLLPALAQDAPPSWGPGKFTFK